MRFQEVRQRLRATLTLVDGWDTYGAEAPNDLARARSAEILMLLELVSLSPISLRPSAEGGIAMSFVESGQRAEIEIYNTGDILTAEYSETGAPVVHEIDAATHTLMAAIRHIRVHLGA